MLRHLGPYLRRHARDRGPDAAAPAALRRGRRGRRRAGLVLTAAAPSRCSHAGVDRRRLPHWPRRAGGRVQRKHHSSAAGPASSGRVPRRLVLLARLDDLKWGRPAVRQTARVDFLMRVGSECNVPAFDFWNRSSPRARRGPRHKHPNGSGAGSGPRRNARTTVEPLAVRERRDGDHGQRARLQRYRPKPRAARAVEVRRARRYDR